MSKDSIFPDLKKVLRNCIAVGLIAGVANFSSIYPPSLEMFWSMFAGFSIAFAVEFAYAYKKLPKKFGHRQNMSTFFLS